MIGDERKEPEPIDDTVPPGSKLAEGGIVRYPLDVKVGDGFSARSPRPRFGCVITPTASEDRPREPSREMRENSWREGELARFLGIDKAVLFQEPSPPEKRPLPLFANLLGMVAKRGLVAGELVTIGEDVEPTWREDDRVWILKRFLALKDEFEDRGLHFDYMIRSDGGEMLASAEVHEMDEDLDEEDDY